MKMKRSIGIGMLLIWSGAGCTALAPTPDPTRFYVLESPPQPVDADVTGLRVGISRIRIPSYLTARTMAVRSGRTEIEYADTHRWAERFEDSLHRVVAAHFRARPTIGSVATPPWSVRSGFDRVVQIELHACEGREDGGVQVSASWWIETEADDSGRVAGHADLSGRWTPGNYGDLAEALSDLVAQLCARVAADIESPIKPAD